jgi:aminoglycoside phosphotransferase (APT) family kinase protein
VSEIQERFSGTGEVREKHRFDVGRLEDYLSGTLAGFERPLTVREFKGGQSNPTYELACPAGRYVLRRKPPGKLLPSAHAVDREYRVIAALNTIDFEVPKAHLLCEDPEVIGTSFYVMERVVGRVLWNALLPDQRPDERRAIYESLYDVLGRLHGADPEALGLADFGRPGNYFARQISRWTKQYRASETETIPEMDRLIEWLPANLPPDRPPTLVHGDYKLDNTIVHPTEPRVIAVLDWELATLGDPLGDLTYQLAARYTPRSVFEDQDEASLRALGIPTQEEVIGTYESVAGPVSREHFAYALAYNQFRTAAILQGILGRVRDGTAASQFATELADGVAPIAHRAWELARRAGA